MKIALFHYHLKPGGVTDVVIYSSRAILTGFKNLTELRLVTGESEGTELVMSRIREGFDRDTADKLRLDILEELAYVEDGNAPDMTKLSQRLEARYDEETLWWVHNYHLGKNPSFTGALMAVATAGRRDMLLHIHDFPECGRPENLAKLDAVMEIPPYPTGSRIRYAVINERDRRILADSGLKDSVTLLPNPVPLTPNAPSDPETLRTALTELCASDNPGYIPGAPNLLYPVRAIRRKNVLEAALLVRLMEEPVNLILTLPGISAQERGYSELVEKAFRDGLIQGVWCPGSTGDQRLEYPKLASSCDAVISTSVQEGFGYLFLNALHWRKPLLSRYLDILDGVLDLFGDYPRRFWADFRVPSTQELADKTQEAYLKKIRTLETTLPDKSIKSTISSVSKLAAGGGIDISYLSVEDQLAALESARDDDQWREEARNLNRELLDSIEKTLKARPPDMDRIIESQFGSGAFNRAFGELVEGFGLKTPTPSPVKIRESVKKAFGRIDYMRLLYDFKAAPKN
ncbi:MAG: glycosyltransferase family 1 protein [Spirochaetaceae bacterium]|nr:glycosyltransferase family 1 protein [Spirochaetaceae bacterium]